MLQNIKKTLYLTNVRPILKCVCVLWDPYQLYLRNELENMQNKATRFIRNNYNRMDSVTTIKPRLNVPTLESRWRYLCHAFITIVQVLIKWNILCHLTMCHASLTTNVELDREYVCKTDIYRNNSFSCTIYEWNAISEMLWRFLWFKWLWHTQVWSTFMFILNAFWNWL